MHGHCEEDFDDGEELNTKELALQIAAELKRYSIPQAIFAERVLCRFVEKNSILKLWTF